MPSQSQAATVAIATARAQPIALWHLLSLDAPAVAALWTWFAARSGGLAVPPSLPVAMFVAVWCLYAGDRLLDARGLNRRWADPEDGELEARHRFHYTHRRWFIPALLAAGLALAPLLLALPPRLLLTYLPLGVLTLAWFGVVHLRPASGRLPKELAVGIIFSAAVFLPALTQAPSPRMLFAAVLFAILLTLNGLFIFRWEHPGIRHANALCQAILGRLEPLTLALALAALLLGGALGVAIALAAAGLLLLDRHRARFGRLTLRTAVDLALLTPLLLSAPHLLAPIR